MPVFQSINRIFFGVLLVVYLLQKCNSIDPEYTWNNRINSFLTASLNSFLTVTKQDEKPLKDDVSFWCCNRARTEKVKTLLDDDRLKEKINFYIPLVIITHGWFDSYNRTWITEMTEDYLLYQETNVCVVDWSRLALQSYAISARNTKKVGNQLGKFIQKLNNEGMDLNRVTLVGHSFGSHISGYAGASVGGRLKAIYALDPAGPRFTKKSLNPTNERLDPSDAQFVQVIHTDATYIGSDFDLGHQDYYPNDGASPQPGCFIPAFQTGIHPSQFLCSHFKAVEYFRASLNPENQFIGMKCDGTFDMFEVGMCDGNLADRIGIYSKKRVFGRFYLYTNEDFPFAMGRSRKRRTTIEDLQKIKESLFNKQFGISTISGKLARALVGVGPKKYYG